MKQMIPTYDNDLEVVLLGSLLLDSRVMTVVVEILLPEKFYDVKHQLIYSAILSLYQSGTPVDLITLTRKLKQDGHLEDAGGIVYISSLTNRVASVTNVQTWCLQLSEYYMTIQTIYRIGSDKS